MKNKFLASFLAVALLASYGTNAMALEESIKQKTETKLEQTNLPENLNKYILNKLEESNFGPENHSLKIDIKNMKSKKMVGDKFKIKADVNYDSYKPVFYSTNKKVATVSKNGKVTCKKPGKVKIVAECNGIKDICNLTVKKNKSAVMDITDSKMSVISSKIGCQTQHAYPSSSIMCSAYSFAYAYYQVTGTMKAPGVFWYGGGCNWNGGTYRRLGSSSAMLSTIKSEIDNNRACVGLLSSGASSTHYVTFYGYTGDGTRLSDYKILDPWDGNLTTGAGYGYCSLGYHVATVNV